MCEDLQHVVVHDCVLISFSLHLWCAVVAVARVRLPVLRICSSVLAFAERTVVVRPSIHVR